MGLDSSLGLSAVAWTCSTFAFGDHAWSLHELIQCVCVGWSVWNSIPGVTCSGYRDSHEFTYVSLSQVIVKSLRSGARIVLKSNVGFEIKKINIFQAIARACWTCESSELRCDAKCVSWIVQRSASW